MRKKVIIESPYAGDITRNEIYARRCMLDSISRGEAPLVSHLLYTQVLDDTIPAQRVSGIECGFAWREGAHLTAVYTDYGISEGMLQGIEDAQFQGCLVEMREIGLNPEDEERLMA